jgi:hypothetical protein
LIQIIILQHFLMQKIKKNMASVNGSDPGGESGQEQRGMDKGHAVGHAGSGLDGIIGNKVDEPAEKVGSSIEMVGWTGRDLVLGGGAEGVGEGRSRCQSLLVMAEPWLWSRVVLPSSWMEVVVASK